MEAAVLSSVSTRFGQAGDVPNRGSCPPRLGEGYSAVTEEAALDQTLRGKRG